MSLTNPHESPTIPANGGTHVMNEGRLFKAEARSADELWFTVSFARLAEAIDDPDPDPRRKRKKAATDGGLFDLATDRLKRFTEYRERIQRPFKGSKKANVPSYKKFLLDKMDGRRAHAHIPQVVLWVPTPLVVEGGYFSLPMNEPVIALDGETQLAARFDLLTGSPARGVEALVDVRLYHGVPEVDAMQIFYECNALGVNMPSQLALLRNQRDPVTHAAREIADLIGTDLIEISGKSTALTLDTVRKALCWRTARKLTFGRRWEPDGAFEQATESFRQFASDLRAAILHEPKLRRPAVFIAICDASVTEDDIRMNEFEWATGVRLNAAGIKQAVANLRQRPIPFEETAADVPLH